MEGLPAPASSHMFMFCFLWRLLRHLLVQEGSLATHSLQWTHTDLLMEEMFRVVLLMD